MISIQKMLRLDRSHDIWLGSWFVSSVVGVISGLVVFIYYMHYYRVSYPFDFPASLGSDIEVVLNALDMLFLALAPVTGVLFGLITGFYFFSLMREHMHDRIVKYVMWVGASFGSFYCALTGFVLFDFIFQNIYISDALLNVLNPFSFAGFIGATVLAVSFWFIYRKPCTKECVTLVLLGLIIPDLIPRTMGIDAYALLLFVIWQTMVVVVLSRVLVREPKVIPQEEQKSDPAY